MIRSTLTRASLAGFITITAMASTAMAPYAQADDYADALDAMCEKTKTCAMAEMGDVENMSEEMKAMIMANLGTMCDGLEKGFSTGLIYQDVKSAATACMNSMAALTCESLMSGGNDKTPECVTLRDLAKTYE